MDTTRSAGVASGFVLRALAWSVGLFGVLRLPWIESHVVLPLTQGQAAIAVRVFGGASAPIEATLACSGTDAIALCLGVILAYPARVRARMLGVVGGLALILALNTARIGTLGRVAASPDWFNALHLYVWPTVLTVAIAGYVFAWMRLSDRPPETAARSGRVYASSQVYASGRFIVLSIAFLLVFVLAAPVYLDSTGVLAVGGFIARVAAVALRIVGLDAHASGNILVTTHGGFLVTQECIVTPLIPIYLAAVVAYATSWRRVVLGLAAAVPLFVVLGIARLMVVVLPGAVASPTFLVHAFFQWLTGVVVVSAAAWWRHRARRAFAYATAGIIVGAMCAVALSSWSMRVVAYSSGLPVDDPQGALDVLLAFQVGLYIALWIATLPVADWNRGLTGVAMLLLMQSVGLILLHVLTTTSGLTVHTLTVRALAIIGPVLAAVAANAFRTPRSALG